MSELSQLTVFLEDGSGAFTKDGCDLRLKVVTEMPTFRAPMDSGKATELIQALCEGEIAYHAQFLRQLCASILPDLRREGPGGFSGWETSTSQTRRWGIGTVLDGEDGAPRQHVYVTGEPHVVLARTSMDHPDGCDAAAVRCLLSVLLHRKREELEKLYGPVLTELQGYLRRN